MNETPQNGKKAVKTIGLMAVIILLAKFMGLLRETMVANLYGQGTASDILNTATQIPLLFFDMVLGVAILSTFVPVFNRRMQQEGEASALEFADCFMTVVVSIAMAAALLGIFLAEPLVRLMTPGYAAIPGKVEATAALLRILFPSIAFTAAAYISVGILQSYGEFTIPSLISVVSNGVMILYLAVFGNRLGLFGVAVSMLVAWMLQLFVQLPWLKKFGYRFHVRFRPIDPGMKEAASIALPVLISSWVQPLCNVINMSFGSSLGDGAVSALNWANKIYIIMVGVFAYAVTNFIFPKLSRLGGEEQGDGFAKMTQQSLGWIFLIITLISALFLALSQPIIRVVFERGAFTAESTAITATALFYYSIGMVGYAVCEVLNKSFYAIGDGKTPMLVSLFGIVANFAGAFVFVRLFAMQVGGLALASAVSSLMMAVLLMAMIQRRRRGTISRRFVKDAVKMLLCSLPTAYLAHIIYAVLSGLGAGMVMTLLRLCLAALPAAVLYLGLCYLLRVGLLRSGLKIFLRK